VVFQLSSSSIWLGEPWILSIRSFLTNYPTMVAICLSSWSSLYYFWVHILGLRYPMPFIGLIGSTLAVLVTFLLILFKFPKSWQIKEEFKIRKMFFLLVIFFTQIILFTYLFLEWAFARINSSYQWLFALTLPFIREGLTNVFAWLCTKSSGIKVYFLLRSGCS
jgi:hypothetical protein